MVGGYGVGSLNIGMAQPSPGITSYFVDDVMTWYYIVQTPMVRLNFDQPADIPQLAQEEWSIYPNPTKTQFTVDLPNDDSKALRITDMFGKLVMSDNLNGMKTIDVSQLPAGIYIVTIDGNTKKLVIQ